MSFYCYYALNFLLKILDFKIKDVSETLDSQVSTIY
jgi:hypothetical protein